jgi:YfiH family protein
MFASRERRIGAAGVFDVAFTDRHGGLSAAPFDSLDLSRSRPGAEADLAANLEILASAFDVRGFLTMRQVQGADVVVVHSLDEPQPVCDALVTTSTDLALCVRVGDCVPVVLADVETGVTAVAHVGRRGVVAEVVHQTIATMREVGASSVDAWLGPHVCGGCYEVPAQLRDEVAAAVPAAYACTTWGTPSLDIGAAVSAQLLAGGCAVNDRSVCTVECTDFFSYRRDGAASGRFAGVVVRRSSGP